MEVGAKKNLHEIVKIGEGLPNSYKNTFFDGAAHGHKHPLEAQQAYVEISQFIPIQYYALFLKGTVIDMVMH